MIIALSRHTMGPEASPYQGDEIQQVNKLHVARTGDMNEYKILVGKCNGADPCGSAI